MPYQMALGLEDFEAVELGRGESADLHNGPGPY